MEVSGIFSAIVVGIVVGALGRLIVPGKQAIGWILTIVLGLVGAFVGGYLAVGLKIDDVWWQTLIVQVVVAAVLVLLVSSLVRSNRRTHT